MTKRILIASLLFAAACGDDSSSPTVDAPPHVVDAAPEIDAGPQPIQAIVVAGDFTAGHPGVLSRLKVADRTVDQNVGPAMAVGDDPYIRKFGNEVFVVNRADGNNVTILDASTLALVQQVATGAGQNPQDVAYDGTTLFVPTMTSKGVLAIKRAGGTVSVIDLSADDPDGKPNCESAVLAGGKLYVACGLLDDTQQFLPPRGPGKVYVVNPTTKAIEQTLTLTTKNPFALLETIPTGAPHAGDLVVATVFFDDGSGCVERIATTGTPAAAGCLVNNTALGGYASRVDFLGSAMLMAVPASDFVHSSLRSYDLSTSTLAPNAVSGDSEVVGDATACPDGSIVATDTTMAASGLRVYKAGAELTTAALAVGLRPTSGHGLICY